jgi:hypothetical protein
MNKFDLLLDKLTPFDENPKKRNGYVSDPSIYGTYGTMFMKEHPHSNMDRVAKASMNDSFKNDVRSQNLHQDDLAKRFGKLIVNGTDGPEVSRRIIKNIETEAFIKKKPSPVIEIGKKTKREKSKKFNKLATGPLNQSKSFSAGSMISYELHDSYDYSINSSQASYPVEFKKTKKYPSKLKVHDLSATDTIMEDERRAGGRFYINESIQPNYEERFTMKPSASVYNESTPKSWPPDTQYTRSESRNIDYHSEIRDHANTNTFGKKPHSKSLKKKINESPNGLLSSSQSPRMREIGTLQQLVKTKVNKCSKNVNLSLSPSRDSLNIEKEDGGLIGENSFYTNGYSSIGMSSHKSNNSHTNIMDDNSNNSLTSLQKTLVGCGHLRMTDKVEQMKKNKISNALKHQKNELNKHGQWLQSRISDARSNNEYNDDYNENSYSNTSLKSVKPKKNNKSVIGNNSMTSSHVQKLEKIKDVNYKYLIGANVNNSAELIQTTVTRNKGYDQESNNYLQIYTTHNTENPFRPNKRSDSMSMNKSSKVSKFNPLDYRQDSKVKKFGNFSAILKTTTNVGDVPTKEAIDKSLAELSRSRLLQYDTRIIETGALLRALQDAKHLTPGVAAIIDLHRGFVDAACMNPDPWVLSRQQMANVINEKVGWLGTDSIKRLLAAYDIQRSGLIRYIRLSTTLITSARPAMQYLVNILNKASEKKKEQQRKKNAEIDELAEQKKAKKSGSGYINYESEIFVLRLIHGLYEDCEGGVQHQIDEDVAPLPVGMRIEDIVEALGVCSCSIDDEMMMETAAEQFIQTLFDDFQKSDLIFDPDTKVDYPDDNITTTNKKMNDNNDNNTLISNDNLVAGGNSMAWSKNDAGMRGVWSKPDASITDDDDFQPLSPQPKLDNEGKLRAIDLIKHKSLKSVKNLPRITIYQFVDCLEESPNTLKVFRKLLTKFRKLVEPYSIKGTISYEQSVNEDLSYGTRLVNTSIFKKPPSKLNKSISSILC